MSGGRGIQTHADRSEHRYRAWAKRRGLRASTGAIYIERLLGKRLSQWSRRSWEDHSRIWLASHCRRCGFTAACYTTEPYDLEEDERREIRSLAGDLDCCVFISEPGPESLWNPNRTFFVQFWARWALTAEHCPNVALRAERLRLP